MLNAMGNVKKLHDVPLIGMTQVLGHHDAPHYITVWLISAFVIHPQYIAKSAFIIKYLIHYISMNLNEKHAYRLDQLAAT